MHQYIINASIQIVPIVQERHPYEWVDEAIEIIKASGIKNEVGAFSTVIEGRYQEVIGLINKINDHLQERGCAEWITNLQIQVRANSDVRSEEKTEKHR